MGDIIYEDLNNDGVISQSLYPAGDQIVMGNEDPRYESESTAVHDLNRLIYHSCSRGCCRNGIHSMEHLWEVQLG